VKFQVGDIVEYNMYASEYAGAPRGWFLGTMQEVDKNDPHIPWRVLVLPEHRVFTHERDGACWFRANHVRLPSLVIEEEPW